MDSRQAHDKLARTKIVTTIGPACRERSKLRQLFAAGADVVRLNTAHGRFDEFTRVIADVRSLESDFGPLGVLLDLAGPKIRLGTLFEDPLDCREGQQYRFVPGDTSTDCFALTSSYPRLLDDLQPGDRVVLADGQVSLTVRQKSADGVVCDVLNGGSIRSRQGINLPGAKLALPSLTDADRSWIAWDGLQHVDYVSLSFVRKAHDVNQLRQLLAEQGHTPSIIAKIEKPEALSDLEAIVEAADAIMVARGDLGVEIDVAEVPVAQKQIVTTCNQRLRPVIVATQMLDSMQHFPRPTRAEATDVANAILDGADACMLSGETAVGEYPVESVRMMNRIMLATETLFQKRPLKSQAAHRNVHPVTHAVVTAAGRVAAELNAKLMVVATRSGLTALTKSSLRDFVPTVAVSGSTRVLRRMSLYWGIRPIANAPLNDRQELREFAIDCARQDGSLSHGDLVLLISGTHLFPDAHNQLVLFQIE